MLSTILDEGVDIGEAHIVRARRNAGDRLEHGRRPAEGHVQALVLEEAPVLGEEKSRSQPLEATVERELDAGLRRGRPCSRQRDRRREEKGGPTDPRQVEEAHGSSLYFRRLTPISSECRSRRASSPTSCPWRTS